MSNEADREKTYLVKGSIEGTDIRFEQSVKMDARQTKTVEIEVDSALLEKGYQVVAKTYQSK